MSTERSKFAAGKRGVIDVNAFYGSMTVGGGEGGGIPLVVRSRVAPLWQRQELDGKTRATRRRDQVADTSSARKVPTVGAKKRRVAASDVPPKKATATTTINIRRNNDNGDYKWHATGRTLTINGSNGKRVATKRVARTGRGMERIVTKWLMMPQSNFGQSSVSSLEDITREAAGDQQHLNLESKPKSILVNSKVSQLLLDEQQQAQLKPLLTKRQQQSLQQSLLLQADSVESMTFVDNSKLAASSAKPSPNSSSNTTSNWHSKSSSNSTYQTTLGICCSSSGSWGHEQPILPQTAGNRGLKITATVIKIMPDLPSTKAITNLPGSGGVTATAAIAVPTTAVTTLPVVTPATVAASKPQKRILHKPKQTQRAERLPPIKLKQPPATATAAAKGTIATATPRATAATAATATVAAKIVRVAQHKIPSTIEDGIDVSYQYFVSKPLARGKKPLPIRYLYRPMMRRLNNTTTAATRHGRRSKKGTSKTDTEPTDADQPPVLSQSSTDVESDSSSEQQQEQRQQQSEAQQQQQQAQPQEWPKKLMFDGEDFKPPPLLVDPKYLPFVKQLKHHPMPKETRAQQQYNIQLQRQNQQYYQQQRQQLEQERWQQENLRQQHLEQQQLQQQYLQQQQLQQEQLRAQQLEQESLEQKQFSILQQMKLQLHKQQRVIHEQQQQLLAHEIQHQQQQQQQEQEQNKRPTLLDYQPNVTRLPAVGGANICFHAPIRMCAGNEAAAAATTATATTATNTETTAISSYPTTAATTAMPTTAAIETATTVPATASMAAATAAGTTAMQSLIAAVRYEDIEMPSCSEKSVSFEMDNKCCCSASNMSPKSRSEKKRKSKARGKKKNRK